jgi:hypothetical protein
MEEEDCNLQEGGKFTWIEDLLYERPWVEELVYLVRTPRANSGDFGKSLCWIGIRASIGLGRSVSSKETYRDLEAACGVSHSFLDAEGDFSVADACALLPGDTSDQKSRL